MQKWINVDLYDALNITVTLDDGPYLYPLKPMEACYVVSKLKAQHSTLADQFIAFMQEHPDAGCSTNVKFSFTEKKTIAEYIAHLAEDRSSIYDPGLFPDEKDTKGLERIEILKVFLELYPTQVKVLGVDLPKLIKALEEIHDNMKTYQLRRIHEEEEFQASCIDILNGLGKWGLPQKVFITTKED